ncbi:DUF1775 domain-containing protein [Symbioplanes lichenis]|uniref:DUF1775 domain-containing protein n=1 Tax=Symbioplanes lichenis TaxID=1629072 RepID=UPI002738798A|nr:DUF1775 domain-containing protein [Actinoplanes lichenis]
MSRLFEHLRAGALAATAAAGVLGFAAPAAADATVTPSIVPQGTGQNILFHVTNTAKSPITKVKVTLPKEMPVAEVYPLSVNDWAPLIDSMTLDTPLTTIHGGTPVSSTAAAITWVAVKGKELPPGQSADLTVSLGPIPTTGTEMKFTIEPTYANPAQGAPMPPVTLELAPPSAADQQSTHSGHDGGTGTTSADDEAMFAALAEAAQDDGPGFWTIAGWVLAGLIAVAGAVVLLRGRRKEEAADDSSSPEADKSDDELVSVGAGATGKAKKSSWRYQEDGPSKE